MAGWDLRKGEIQKSFLTENELWSAFNFFFSDFSKKNSTYKFGFLKSILDNLFNAEKDEYCLYISYERLFEKFTENYWNLIVKYGLKQKQQDTSNTTKLEKVLNEELQLNPEIKEISFYSISFDIKKRIIKKVTANCKNNVVGALYKDLGSFVYSFDLSGEGIFVNAHAFNFMVKYKVDLEKLNYYHWAKFLEKINDEEVLVRVLDKLELATPQRNDLSIYREILKKEFETDVCFYCGMKLYESHVDHFIPWSFVKEDKLWNFVLACPKCNLRKSNKLPKQLFLTKIQDRNLILQKSMNNFIKKEFSSYRADLLPSMWNYAKNAGFELM